jgi:TonB family protein
MQRRSPSCFLVFLSFIALVFCPRARAQESTVAGLTDHLVEQLEKAQKKHFFPKILVIDFSSRPGRVGALGEYFADQLSDALAKKMTQSAVIDRKKLHSHLLTNGISPFDLADREIAKWIASELGANAIVFGTVTPAEEKIILSSELIRLGDDKKLSATKVYLPLNDQVSRLLSQPLDWPASPDVLVSCIASSSSDEIAASFREAGVTKPTCIHCPDPEYSDDARRAKFQGNLKFDVVVDDQGHARHISTVSGDKHGLTTRAIEAIKGWKFSPAVKAGKPVTVCVVIEVTFRMF